ncbi:hypothetical protein [Halosimplex sp. TS25]|uniref:hypothetical protein n=1 Tax=Halosimplex rarum TaxID=3396619 RepID=UPI0039EA15AB
MVEYDHRSKHYDEVGIELDFPNAIRVGQTELRTPGAIGTSKQVDGGVVVALDPESEPPPRTDFELPDPSRSVLRVDPPGEVVWFVEGISHPDVDNFHHATVNLRNSYGPVDDDALVTESNVGGYCYHVNPDTGAIVDSWRSDDWNGLTIASIAGLVECDSGAVRLPWDVPDTAGRYAEFDTGIVVRLDPNTAGSARPDFEPTDPARNLVKITRDCRIEWVVESSPGLPDGDYHERHWRHGDRLITRTTDGGFTEVDPATGSVLATWGAEEFVCGDVCHALDGSVESFAKVDGVTRVRTDRRLYWLDDEGRKLGTQAFDTSIRDVRTFADRTVVNTESGSIYGIDSDCSLAWEFDDGNDWLLGPGEDGFYLFFDGGGRRPYSKMKFEFDPRRGELVRSVTAPDWLVDEVL